MNMGNGKGLRSTERREEEGATSVSAALWCAVQTGPEASSLRKADAQGKGAGQGVGQE